MCWQRQWPDQPHGTLVLPLKTILCPVRPKNLILFKVGHHARNRNTAFYHSLQPVTCYLTTTDFLSGRFVSVIYGCVIVGTAVGVDVEVSLGVTVLIAVTVGSGVWDGCKDAVTVKDGVGLKNI